MNLKEIWKKYEESDHVDPVLDKAIEKFEEETGFSTDEVIDAVDKIASGNFLSIFAANSFPLVKIASAGEKLAGLLDAEDYESAADLIANVVAKGSTKDKIALISTYKTFADSEYGSDVEKTPVADELKKRKIWNVFNSFYQKNVANVMSGMSILGPKFNLQPGTLPHAWQEFAHAKANGAPAYIKMAMITRLGKIIISGLIRVGGVLGVLGLGLYGAKKIKDLWDDRKNSLEDIKKDIDSTKPATKQEDSINTTEDDVEARSKKLFEAIDKRLSTVGGE